MSDIPPRDPARDLAERLLPPCDDRFVARANVVGAWALILFAGTGMTLMAAATGGTLVAVLWCLAGVSLGVATLYHSTVR